MAMSWLTDLATMKVRKMAERIIAVGVVLGSAYTIWTLLILLTKCESPVVVVLRQPVLLIFLVGAWSRLITEETYCS